MEIHEGQIKVALISAVEEQIQGGPDIVARIINPQGVHRAYAVSGGISCCTASAIEGTIVNDFVSRVGLEKPQLVIGHPEGTLDITVELGQSGDGELKVLQARLGRNARLIMKGTAYI